MLRRLKTWIRKDDASAGIEAGLMFPVMMAVLLGVVDIGMGLTVNQKVINAAHMISDLLTREDDITDAELAEAVTGGRLVLMPYNDESFGYDVAGVKFIGKNKVPTVQWRDTFNMAPNAAILTESQGLGEENEGVVVVTVSYHYAPYFSNFVVNEIEMQETAYARGRKGLFVTRS